MEEVFNTSNYSKSYFDRSHLLTEKVNQNSHSLDQLDSISLVKLFSREDLEPQKAVSYVVREIAQAIDLISTRLKSGGRLFYLGAGTSGRLGVLDASECPPTFCTSPDLVQGIIAGGEKALVSSSEGLEDVGELAREDLLERDFNNKDCLVGITAGGTTPYVVSGLSYSKEIGATSIAISCVQESQAKLPCDIDIRIITGPEILTGSTRLKAGTATKMVLNMISTGVMVRLGKVFGNRMIDVSASNTKLVDRSLRILNDLAGVDRGGGIRLLKKSHGSVKLALLMSIAGLSAHNANTLLKELGGDLRAALSELGKLHD